MGRNLILQFLLASASTFLAGATQAAEPDCYDAEVSARITRQTPTVAGDCGPDCIIISWPWIVDLDVRRVYSGVLSRGSITVLTLQHTYWGRSRVGHRYWLRRNTVGTFNVLQVDESQKPERCAADALPAQAFIRPPEGKTLDDLRQEGEARYGPDPYALVRNGSVCEAGIAPESGPLIHVRNVVFSAWSA